MPATAFEQLRILNKRQLRECTLSHLGKVNVVCGRNSSGKSTLLEGIADPKTRFPGTLFDLGFKQVVGILDGDKAHVAKALNTEFREYTFLVNPREDIRTKKDKQGLLSESWIPRPDALGDAAELFAAVAVALEK